MWFALRASYLVAVVLCNVQESRQDEDTKRSFLARRAIDGSRGRKYYEAKDDGFFEDYGFDRGDYGSQDRFGVSDIRRNVPGEPGIDYPAYERLPQTSFSCEGRDRGYYADEQAGCQMFHVCDDILVSSFLCPVGSLFSQKFLTCDWWNKVDCSTAKKFYAVNRNLYQQHDGDEMIRKAYVMVNLHPDRGLTTEPEERERQGKIVHFSRVDTPEIDLPNNYYDLSSDQDYRGFSPTFEDYSNQLKTKMNSREEENLHDHVLYSHEYQTHAPKMYQDSPIVRIHKITDDSHLTYENRQKSKSKEQSSYRFPVNEFQNEFQPSYAPTVPTVTTTTRRFYSPTVPTSFRSSTLSYKKLDQNFDSSVHRYAQGKYSQTATTPATIFRNDSRSQRNSTRDSYKHPESKQEVMKVTVSYNGREENYNERETYDQDQLYDEELDNFEIMEGRESIGLAQSPSERLGETTVHPLETKSDSRKINNLNSTIQNNQDLQFANLEYKKEPSNLQEVIKSSASSKESEKIDPDVKEYPTFIETTSFEQGYDSSQGPKDEYETKMEEIPVSDDYYDLNSDFSTTTSSVSYQNKDIIVEHQNNQGMIEKQADDGSKNTLSSQNMTDNFSTEDHEDLKGHDDLLMSSLSSHPYNTTSESLQPEEQSILRLSVILQPPFEIVKPFHINVEELASKISTESQTSIPIPYQRYSDLKDVKMLPNSTENALQIKKSSSDNENPSKTARSNSSDHPNSSNHQRFSRLESSEVNVPATDIVPPLEDQQEGTSEFLLLLDEHLEHKDDPVQSMNSSNDKMINISVPSIHQEPPKFNHTNYEAQFLSQYNPNLDFTIRSAIWNQPSISENKDPDNSSTPVVENSLLNHRTISLELEPPNQTPSGFEDDIFPRFQSLTPESELSPPLNTENLEFNSQNAEADTKSEERNLFESSSTLKPDFPSSIAEIEDTIEESNTPYQMTLTLNGNQDLETIGKDLIGKLVNQHEKGSSQEFTSFEDFKIAKSEEPSLPRTHEEPSIIYAKTDFSSNPFLKNHFGQSTESTSYDLNPETHSRTEKAADIRNLDSDVHRMSVFQLMSELAKANRLPRPFSQQKSEISASEKSKSSKEPSLPRSRTSTRFFENPFLSSVSGSSSPFSTNSPPNVPSDKEERNNITLTSNKNESNSVSSTENPSLRKEVILEQLEKNFGQPLYGSLREPLFELPKQDREYSFDLPGEERLTDFKTGKAILQKKSKQLVEAHSEASTTAKPNFEKETEKTVIEMEFVPSLGFSFDTHEGREEYAKAVIQGLVTEEAVLKSEDQFSTSTQTIESDESTKNLKSNKNK